MIANGLRKRPARMARAAGRPQRGPGVGDGGSYLAISSSALIVSVNSAASTFAAPGSPGRATKTSLPTWPNVAFSSFFPSSNFAVTAKAGLSVPVLAAASTNEVARMFASFDVNPSAFSRSRSAGFGLTRRHVSCAFSPWPFTCSSTTVWPSRVSSMRLALNGAELEDVLAPVVVGALLQVVGSALSTVTTDGFDASRA